MAWGLLGDLAGVRPHASSSAWTQGLRSPAVDASSDCQEPPAHSFPAQQSLHGSKLISSNRESLALLPHLPAGAAWGLGKSTGGLPQATWLFIILNLIRGYWLGDMGCGALPNSECLPGRLGTGPGPKTWT